MSSTKGKYLLQRVTQDELWEMMHDPEKRGIHVPDHPGFYCVFSNGLVRFWPPLTPDILLTAERIKI